MRLFSLAIAILLFYFNAKPQSLDLVWPLGYDTNPMANFNFCNGSLVVDTDTHILNYSVTNASISDSSGHLLMYTNGCFIVNLQDDTMLNGSGLNPDICVSNLCGYGLGVVQGDFILPLPGSTQFYLFHQNCNYSNNARPNKLYYSIIDLNLDSGRGEVLNKNTLLYANNMCDGTFSAVKHANGIDWWVLVHNRFTDEFVEFLLTGSGIQGPFTQTIGPAFIDDSKGNSKFSPDGNKFITTTEGSNIHIFDFNRCTGSLSNYQFIQNPYPSIVIGFIEFSSTSHYLYFILSQYIYQYDMFASNISLSAQVIATNDGFSDTIVGPFPTLFGIGQLAPDKKIYISSGATHYFHTINFPDSGGIACNVSQHNIFLPCKNDISVPSLPNYHLGALDPHICDSINIVNRINLEISFEIFPNPAHDNLILKYKGVKPIHISIYDMFGQIVNKMNKEENSLNGEIQINITLLKAGVYYLLLEDDSSICVRKFIKL